MIAEVCRSGSVLRIWLAAALAGAVAVRAGAEIRAEAEDAVRVEAVVETALAGYSGRGYVTGITSPNAQVTLKVDAEEGVYDLFVGYATAQFKRAGLRVNGQASEIDLPPTRDPAEGNTSVPDDNVFGEVFAARVVLPGGTHTLEFSRGWGYYDLDYIRLIQSPALPLEPVPAQLSDPDATDSARRLFERLRAWYGKKMLSGQYGIEEYARVRAATGMAPALFGADLIDYSPSRVEHGQTPEGTSERWIELVKEFGAIPTVCWHWNAPSDLVDSQQTPWWFGFYTRGTTFDLAAALADKEAEPYQLLLRDIDVIAAELQKFQVADIPVLWRPLHEASGGWFWWGARGAAPFQELWRLLHDRLVNHHGLHNLIWVYTHDAAEWYPGDDVVDLIGVDEYEPAGAYWSGEWRRGLNQFGGKKMLSVSECGAPPDPERMARTGTRWLTFVVWEGAFLDDIPAGYLKAVYTHPDVLTAEDLR